MPDRTGRCWPAPGTGRARLRGVVSKTRGCDYRGPTHATLPSDHPKPADQIQRKQLKPFSPCAEIIATRCAVALRPPSASSTDLLADHAPPAAQQERNGATVLDRFVGKAVAVSAFTARTSIPTSQVRPARFLAGKRVLVPLCGKTIDLLWFRSHAAHVVGVELCEFAVRQFFDEQAICLRAEPRPLRGRPADADLPGHLHSRPDDLGPLDFVYDRAALVALPLPMRLRYVAKIDELTPRGTVQFVNTVHYHPILDTPPFSIGPDDIERYHGGRYLIEHVECALLPNHGMVRKFHLNWLIEHGFRLTTDRPLIRRGPRPQGMQTSCSAPMPTHPAAIVPWSRRPQRGDRPARRLRRGHEPQRHTGLRRDHRRPGRRPRPHRERVSSVSADPPMLLACINRQSPSPTRYGAMAPGASLLAADQAALADVFAGRHPGRTRADSLRRPLAVGATGRRCSTAPPPASTAGS